MMVFTLSNILTTLGSIILLAIAAVIVAIVISIWRIVWAECSRIISEKKPTSKDEEV